MDERHEHAGKTAKAGRPGELKAEQIGTPIFNAPKSDRGGREASQPTFIGARLDGTPAFFQTTHLCSPALGDLWTRIIVPANTKERLLSYLDSLTALKGSQASAVGLALRRAILILGEPGTGKSSLAQGAPNEWSRMRNEESFLLTLNPHHLASGERGGSQKNVGKMFEALDDVASIGPTTFVVVDEVETIATHRGRINAATNPQDSIHSVNAWLQGLDAVVQRHPNVNFIFTTNFYANLDPAFIGRVDFSLVLGLPNSPARLAILQDAVREVADLAAIQPPGECDASTSREWDQLVKSTKGLSPRQIRHLPVSALTFRRKGERLQLAHLVRAAQEEKLQQQFHRKNGGMCLHGFEQSNGSANGR